jgi:segregation and condensation protein A
MLPRHSYTVQLPVFEGPLDLLLQLIEREELDITRVALAQITDQFLGYIKVLESLNIADLADFLVVAARLILIKSEALLPRPVERPPGEADPGDELARQLIAYKKYKQIAGQLRDREAAGYRTFLRLAPPPKSARPIAPLPDPRGLSPLALLDALRRALAVAPDLPPLGTVVAPPKVTIRDQIRLIARALRASARVSFQKLLETASSKMEVIVTFLAVLELIKRRQIEARQDELFGEIELLSIGEWTEDEAALAELEFE